RPHGAEVPCASTRHRGLDDRKLPGKPCGTADLEDLTDHRVGDLVRVVEGAAVGQHRDVELVDVTPHGDVQPAGGGQRPHRVDLGDQRTADPATFLGAHHIRHGEILDLVLPVDAG